MKGRHSITVSKSKSAFERPLKRELLGVRRDSAMSQQKPSGQNLNWGVMHAVRPVILDRL